MPAESIQITVDVDKPTGYYLPGDYVQVTVTITAPKDTRVRDCVASLIFYERHQSGFTKAPYESSSVDLSVLGAVGTVLNAVQAVGEVKHVVDYMTQDNTPAVRSTTWREQKKLGAKVTIFESELITADSPVVYDLELAIPSNAAPTYDGAIIQHRWALRVALDVPLAPDISSETDILVTLPAPPPEQETGVNTENGPRSLMLRFLQLETPRLTYYEGETITGTLIVDAVLTLRVDEIRVELWRSETVDDGSIQNSASMMNEQIVLAHNAQLVQGSPFTSDFSLPVQILNRVSYIGQVTEIVWYLKGVVVWDKFSVEGNASVDLALSLYSVPPS